MEIQLLNPASAIADKTGKPTKQFQLFWQIFAKQVSSQEGTQDQLIETIQQQQIVIGQLLGVVTEMVVYQNAVSEYLANQASAAIQRLAFTQCAVGTIAIATGVDISGCGDPSDFPPWPTPPTPPWEEP